jgi:hypothetical protein
MQNPQPGRSRAPLVGVIAVFVGQVDSAANTGFRNSQFSSLKM